MCARLTLTRDDGLGRLVLILELDLLGLAQDLLGRDLPVGGLLVLDLRAGRRRGRAARQGGR
jgi:hypothetical protein